MTNLRDSLLEAYTQGKERKEARSKMTPDEDRAECEDLVQTVDNFFNRIVRRIPPVLRNMAEHDFNYGVLFAFNAHEWQGPLFNQTLYSTSGRTWDTEYIISGAFVARVARHFPDKATTLEQRLQQYVENGLRDIPGGIDPTNGNRYIVSCLWKKNINTSRLKNGILISRNGIKYSHYNKNKAETQRPSAEVTDNV